MHAAYSTCKVRLILVDVDLMIRPKEEMGDASKHHLIRALEQVLAPTPAARGRVAPGLGQDGDGALRCGIGCGIMPPDGNRGLPVRKRLRKLPRIPRLRMR